MTTRTSWKDNRNLSGNHSPEYRHSDSFHPDPRDIALAREVLRPILDGETDGATIDDSYNAADCRGAYVVGGRYPGYQLGDWNPIDVLAYMLHRYVVQTPTFGDGLPKLVGIWRDNGVIYFDRVTLHSRYLDALDVAKDRKQVAFFDAAINRSIDTATEQYI